MQTYKVTVNQEKTIRWYNEKNQLHRLDGPAIEWANGSKSWWVNGNPHRLDGPAFEYADGNKEWFVEGKRHRLDGPAIEYANGYKAWFVDGKRHRLDGPSVEFTNGYKSWWVEGKQMSEKEFNEYIKPTCEGKIVEVDGIKYKLTAI